MSESRPVRVRTQRISNESVEPVVKKRSKSRDITKKTRVSKVKLISI